METFDNVITSKYVESFLYVLWKNIKYDYLLVFTNKYKCAYVYWQPIYAQIRSFLLSWNLVDDRQKVKFAFF